jgi:hypothetical protein
LRLLWLEILFDWRMRILPGHEFSLVVWDVVEEVTAPLAILLKNASQCSS